MKHGFVEITKEEIRNVPEEVKVPMQGEVNFDLMIKAEKWDFRNTKKLKKMVETRFYNGLQQQQNGNEISV